jgi:type II secretory pathway component GspD/PulD (secretin)
MSRMRYGLLIVLGLTSCLTAVPLGADEPKQPFKRDDGVVYVSRYLPPADLAKALNAYFQGRVEAVPVSDKTSNVLVISTTSAIRAELLATLEKLDRKPSMLEVEVLIAELRADAKEGPAKVEEAALSGPTDRVNAKLQAMQKAGQLAALRHFKLSALENQRATLRMGENRPYTIGSTINARGISTGSINYRELGTTLSLTPRLAGSDCIVDLELEDSGMLSDSGTSAGTDDNGKPLPAPAPSFGNSRLQTSVGVPAGASVLVKGVKTEAKGRDGQTFVILTVRNLDAPAEKK